MATRYAGEFEFDHGTQFFTARTPAFREFLQPLIDAGVVAVWRGRFAELRRDTITDVRAWDDSLPHYVGSPRMNSIGKSLARDLNIQLSSAVTRLDHDGAGWQLGGASGSTLGRFDWVVLTAPAPQTANLAPRHSALCAIADAAPMQACYALMLGCRKPPDLRWQAALVREADISWISVNSSKPGRAGPCTLVFHSTNAWADAHIDDDILRVHHHLLTEASSVTGVDLSRAEHAAVHRWRYANIEREPGEPYWIDRELHLAACGDWFCRGRVEAAFSSAAELLGELREWLG